MQMNPMQGGYDRAITVFSPEGRLYQVEYAREAVKRGNTAIGIKYKNGIILAVDKRIKSKLIEQSSIEKIHQIDEHILAASSGLMADARVLIDRARVECQINKITYDEPMSVEALAKKVSDIKQLYTQHGGSRPFGIALLIAGVDRHSLKLFETDPSGALIEYKAVAIGNNRNSVTEILEEKYSENITKEKAIELILYSLIKSAGEEEIKAENIEMAVICDKNKKTEKITNNTILKAMDKVIKEIEEEKKEKEENENTDNNEKSEELNE